MPGAADLKASTNTGNEAGRRVLFLQGPLSPLFRLVGDLLKTRGMTVFRINFCAGDWLHWHGEGCANFKETSSEWPGYIERFLVRNKITDLVLHGDQRIYHRVAVKKALELDIHVAVTELGALRPGWMTLERNGLSTLSHFPTDPDAIRDIARRAGNVDLKPMYPSSFWLQTAPDVIYNLVNVFLSPLFPGYERHTIYPPVEEYLRGAVRLLKEGQRTHLAETSLRQVQDSGKPYFVLPIQLEGDFQLRRHSPYDSFVEVLQTVFSSFASTAPAETRLILKSHPLDVGFENWAQVSKELAAKYDLGTRVHYLDGGGLAKPFEKASGVVTLNSTAGLEALQACLPVKTLVPAHYDIDGLTHQGSLETFWSEPEGPDPELLTAYVIALAASTQVRGSIHNREGVVVAARNIAERIEAHSINAFGAFVDPPPRLARARALGVPL
ncbi:capsule biosynthesis protein [Roseibium sp. Sym1]|uniref:capsule biosynthesis protein n=1 Tax=Roseibium sp. Sym1 TaxID=3016006 RepID=UPI0022B3E6BD|nr:capsular biosynthesis protein [Roseibium sp. Sym1]